MGKMRDLTGLRFGRLLVIRRAENDIAGRTMWLCKCDCGNEKIVYGSHLKNGVKSCGCYRKEKTTTHGGKGTRVHRIWENMKARCYNHNNTAYRRYGGRGIAICAEWKTFDKFRDWAMSSGYSDELTIDRIDPDGNYCPENCRWVTNKVQQNNLTTNHMLQYNGLNLSIAQWAEKCGIPYTTLLGRISRGWSVEKALTTPVKKNACTA